MTGIDTPLTIPASPPGGVSLPPPPELYSVADYVRYGMLAFAASIVARREQSAGYTVVEPRHCEEAQRIHDTVCRAIVPYEFHRELRRVRKMKRLHPKHPHFFYRYAEQSGKHARPIKNWLYVQKIKTDPDDGSYYQPCGAVPLPAPATPVKSEPVREMRYTYLGDKLTAPHLIGMQCDPVRRPDGKCVVGQKPKNQLVEFENGERHTVLARRLRLNKKADVTYIPVPAMRHELPVPAGYFPEQLVLPF